MNITDIRIRKIYDNSKMKAIVSVTINDEFAIHDIKIIDNNRLFIAMPNRKDENGKYRDICHPITFESRCKLEEAIIKKYKEFLNEI